MVRGGGCVRDQPAAAKGFEVLGRVGIWVWVLATTIPVRLTRISILEAEEGETRRGTAENSQTHKQEVRQRSQG